MRANSLHSSRVHALLLLLIAAAIAGCSSGPSTRLTLVGNPRGNAEYSFRDVFWRAQSTTGEPEFVGYGLLPFINESGMRDYDPHWPTRGYVTMRLLAEPSGKQNEYALTLLGPSMSLGPGDDEVLTGSAQDVVIETGPDNTRILRISGAAMRSRNKPGLAFQLGGTIIAKPASDDAFMSQYRQFQRELSYRGPAPTARN